MADGIAPAATALDDTVTSYMLGKVDGGQVARAQQEFWSARLWEERLARGRQGVTVTWNDNALAVLCQRDACMVTTAGRRWWWQEDLDGAYLSIEEVAGAVDAHAAVHRGEPWDG